MVHRLVSGFLERTFMATPSCTLVATELGYLFILQQQVKEASLWYKEAMKLEENRLAALAGLWRLGRAGQGDSPVGCVPGNILSRLCMSSGVTVPWGLPVNTPIQIDVRFRTN